MIKPQFLNQDTIILSSSGEINHFVNYIGNASIGTWNFAKRNNFVQFTQPWKIKYFARFTLRKVTRAKVPILEIFQQ